MLLFGLGISLAPATIPEIGRGAAGFGTAGRLSASDLPLKLEWFREEPLDLPFRSLHSTLTKSRFTSPGASHSKLD